MKNILLAGYLFFFTFAVNAQENDSILTDTIFIKGLVNEYVSNAQYKEALSLIHSIDFPDKEALMQEVFCFQSLNNYRMAIELLSVLKEEYPQDIPIRMRLIECYESINEYRKGCEILEELIALQPESAYFQIKKGDLLYRDDRPAIALDIYKEVNDYDPVYLNKRIGMCYEKIGEIDSAGIYYNQAWEADPLDAFSALSLVKMQLKNKDYLSALQNSEIFLVNSPDNLQMKILNAYSYYNLDNYPEAIERFEHCRELGDSSLITIRGLGISYYFEQKDSLAYPNLHKAYAMDTTNTVVLFALGKTTSNMELYAESVDAFTGLLDRLKVDGSLYYAYHRELGNAYSGLKDYNNAVTNYLLCLQYASQENKIELSYLVASISENELQDNTTAIFYYKMYHRHLDSYKYSLETEKPDFYEESVQEVNFKLEELAKHISLLQSQDTTLKWSN
jgi:Tfp pilus assembly protein PilF